MNIFVTGATAGFGEAITRKFIKNGHTVIAAGRRLSRLEALKDELGDALTIVQLDVRNRAAIQLALESLPTEKRHIDVLVNNAGLALGLEPAHKANVDDWDTMIDTNAKGLVNMTRAILVQPRLTGHMPVVMCTVRQKRLLNNLALVYALICMAPKCGLAISNLDWLAARNSLMFALKAMKVA